MPVEISVKKGTSNPTSTSGLTLGEPAFNYSNNTLWIGKGSGNTPVWVGAGVCGASGGIAAGLTYQIPTLGAVKDYFSAVSSAFLGTTASYVATFNGATGAVTGVSSFNGLTGAVTGASLGANTFTGLQTLTAGLTTSFAYVSGGLTVGGSLYVNGNLTVSGGVTTSISEIVLIEDNIITLNSNVTGTPTENAGIEIKRGTSANTQILWNESTDKWTFTNNGTLYYDIPTDYVSSFNGLTGAVGGVTTSAANTFTALNSFNAGISAAGATLSGTVTAPTPAVGTNNTQVATTAFVQNEIVADTVTTFNGRTGAVQGVSAAVAGSYITVSAATGSVTITNTGVQTFNGLTGAVTGVTVGGANTFTALNSFNAGISAAGITVGSSLFLGADPSGYSQIKALPDDSSGGLYVYMPVGRIGDINNHWGNGIQIGVFADEQRILMGDVDGVANSTTVEINDGASTITLSGYVSANSLSSGNLTSTGDVVFGAASAFVNSQTTTLGTTADNQNIAAVAVFDGAVYTNRSVEFFVQASTSTAYEALKIMVIHDGTNTYNTQYGLIRTGASLCSSYTTTIGAGVGGTGGTTLLRLRATPTNTNTTFKVIETVIPA